MNSLIAITSLLCSLAAAAPTALQGFNTNCNTLAENSGALVPGDGSVEAYIADNFLQAAAKNAPTPSGYTSAFTNTLGAALLPDSYITYFPLNATYDTNTCAAHCNAEPACKAFNVYFARDPKYVVHETCTESAPVTNIRCALFAAEVVVDKATNANQYTTADPSSRFERVQVGSNGYNRVPEPSFEGLDGGIPGFRLQDTLGNAAIQAVDGDDAYMTVSILPTTSAPAACAHQCATATHFGKHCVFFNTYTELLNGANVLGGVKCALFAKAYGKERALNEGYVAPGANVTIAESRTFGCEEC